MPSEHIRVVRGVQKESSQQLRCCHGNSPSAALRVIEVKSNQALRYVCTAISSRALVKEIAPSSPE